MELTSAQLGTLNGDITADQSGAATAFKANPTDQSLAQALADLYNAPAASDFFGNYKKVPVSDIFNTVAWKNYTMTDKPPTAAAPSTPTVAETYALSLHMSRAAFANAFQMNIQTLLISRDFFDATKSSLVSALKDATNTNMPTGSAGADLKAGWGGASGVQTILCRKGTRAEKLFADTSVANGSTNLLAATFVQEGTLVYNAIQDAWLNH